MNIVVTGGAGFIGSNIVKLLLEKGHSVKVIDNLSTGYKVNLNNMDVEFIEGDIKDIQFLNSNFKGIDCIYHLAASVGNIKSIEDPYFDLESNYTGTLNVLNAALKNSVLRIIYSSSSAGYGEPKYIPLDEDHPLNPDSPYGVSKISAEKLIHSFSRIYGFTAVSLRYFNAYGINQRYDAYGNAIPIFCDRLQRGQNLSIYGTGGQTRDFINVEDIAEANFKALSYGKSGVFNIATGESIELNELVETLKKVTGKKFEVFHLEARKGEVMHSRGDISHASKELGFLPKIGIETGLKKYTEWFFNEFNSEVNH